MDFTLRPFCIHDAASIRMHADNPHIAQFLRDGFPHPFTLQNAAALIKRFMESPADKVLARAVCVDDQAVGSIGLFVLDDVYCKTADLAYWLGETYWGYGIMPRAIRSICMDAFSCFDIVRIQAEPFANNTASHSALEKAGFVCEGTLRSRVCKNGHVQDARIYAMLKE